MAASSQKWTVQVKGDKELQRKIKNMGLRLPDILEPAAAAGAMVVVAEAQNNAEKGHPSNLERKTGTLIRSIAESSPVKTYQSGTRCTMAVGSSLEYARIHEFGGTIEAKNGGKLRFQTEDGAWHQVSSVHIPARPYLRPAIDENADEIEQAIGQEFIKRLVAIS